MEAPRAIAAEEVVRCFFAVPLPDGLRAALVREIEALRRVAGPTVRWVRPGNLHLTLHFVGDVFGARLSGLAALLDEAAAAAGSFRATVRGLGCFGPPRAPRVVWAGLDRCPPELESLYRQLAAGTRGTGRPAEERPFRPHVTLGRLRPGRRSAGLTSRLESPMSRDYGPLEARRALLMRSRLLPEGPEYTPLHEARLGGS